MSMKKFVYVLLGASAALTLSIAAQAEDKSDGCGLGWQITKEKTMSATTTRGTTNSFVPPTYGMTSGTIGCDAHSLAKNEENAARFAVNNHEALNIEMAQGSGENLHAFAQTLGCSDAAAFGRAMQDNYSAVAGSASGIELFSRVRSTIQSDAALSASCGV